MSSHGEMPGRGSLEMGETYGGGGKEELVGGRGEGTTTYRVDRQLTTATDNQPVTAMIGKERGISPVGCRDTRNVTIIQMTDNKKEARVRPIDKQTTNESETRRTDKQTKKGNKKTKKMSTKVNKRQRG